MANNVGTLDRVIRVTVGIGLLALVFVGPASALGWIGIVPLATGLFGSCPLYQLLGLNAKCDTCHDLQILASWQAPECILRPINIGHVRQSVVA
jgi:hypothetical protein